MLSELESAQNQAFLTLTEEEISIISANKKNKRIKRANNSDKLMMVAMVLKFVD